MSVTRVLLKAIVCLGVFMLGVVLLAKPIGKVLPHGQFVPIRVENSHHKFYAWFLLESNRSIFGRITSRLLRLGDFSPDTEHMLVTSFKEEDQCYWSIYSWVDASIENFHVSKTCAPIATHWSPDNQHIVFNTNLTGDLYILSLASGEVNRVYHDSHINQNAVWSPDGKLLAFLLTPPALSSNPSPLNTLRFIRMNCDADCEPVSDIFATVDYPVLSSSWSPDQSHMAFLSKGYGSLVKLYIWDAGCLAKEVPDCTLQESQFREIVLNKATISTDLEPIWSSDGQYLMFTAAVNRRIGFYRVRSNCYEDANGCKLELLVDFDNLIPHPKK